MICEIRSCAVCVARIDVVAVTIMTSQTACKTSAADAVTSADARMVPSAVKIYKSDRPTNACRRD
jgi:hypothetical protein